MADARQMDFPAGGFGLVDAQRAHHFASLVVWHTTAGAT